MMPVLNLPSFEPVVRINARGLYEILDLVRRRFVRLTPEEWVRQHFINYLTGTLSYPPALLVVEAGVTYNRLKKRFDLVAYDRQGNARMVVECKAPDVPVKPQVFDQAAIYAVSLRVDYLVVTNGMMHYICRIDKATGTWSFLPEIPHYSVME